MSTLARDYRMTVGMRTASPAALSCVETVETNVIGAWALAESRDFGQPSCFRLFRSPSTPFAGVCPSRKQGPEDKSHKSLPFSVAAGRNVA